MQKSSAGDIGLGDNDRIDLNGVTAYSIDCSATVR